MSEPPYDLSADIGRIVQVIQRAPSVFNNRPWWFEPRPPYHVDLWLPAWSASTGKARARYGATRARAGDAASGVRTRGGVTRARAREYVISCGAALFNLRVAIRAAGHDLVVWMLPDPAHAEPMRPPALLASVEILTARPAKPGTWEQELYEAIWRRHTNRWPYDPAPLAILVAMENAAAREGAYLRLLQPRQVRSCLHLVAETDRDQAFKAPFPDFVSRAAYGPTPENGEPVTRRDFWLNEVKRRFEHKPQLMALSTDDDEPADWLRAGQALQRAILTGTRFSRSAPYGLAAKYPAPHRYRLSARHHVLAPDELARYSLSASFLTQPFERDDIAGRYRKWPRPWRYPELPQMLLRVGYAVQPEDEEPLEADMAGEQSRSPWQPPRGAMLGSESGLRTGD
jgi:hypothetical protein